MIDKVDRVTEAPGFRERKAYLILVAISIFLALASGMFTIQQVHDSNHKFCQLITVSLGRNPAPTKPSNPKEHESRERAYEDYMLVRNLGHSLGCL